MYFVSLLKTSNIEYFNGKHHYTSTNMFNNLNILVNKVPPSYSTLSECASRVKRNQTSRKMYVFLMWMMLVAVDLASSCTTCEMGLLKFEKYHSLT